MVKATGLLLLTVGICLQLEYLALGQTMARPNVVLIFADDLGYGDVSCYNPDSRIRTPNLDRLASEGIQMTDAHSASAVCTPSRYALLTGRHSWRTELKSGVLGGFSLPLIEPGRKTLGDLFKQRGYATACIGKWHLGMEWDRPHRGDQEYAMRQKWDGVDFSKRIRRTPTSNGFDLFFGISASLDMPPYVFIENDRVVELPASMLEFEDKGGRPGPATKGWRHKYVMSAIIDKTIEFVGEYRNEPFFAYVPLNSPHTPHAPADAFVGTSGMDVYGDFVVEVDHHVGRVMQALSDLRLADNTLFIVTSDNGPETNMYERLQQTGHDSSGLLLGSKRDNWEGGHRVPFIARWPGVIRAGSGSSDPFCLVDLMATFADLLEVNLPESEGVDSVTALPLLKGESGAYRESHAIIHHSSGGRFAIRRGDWKLLLHSGSGGNNYSVKSGRRAKAYAGTLEQRLFDSGHRQLYNMRLDMAESQNLATEHPEIVAELTSLATEYIKNGRSTPGSRQGYVAGDWPQIDWVD